jgi:hypothetical protein
MNKEKTTIESILKNIKTDSGMVPSVAFRTNARIRILNTVASSKIASPMLHYRSIPFIHAFRLALLMLFFVTSTVYAAQSSNPHDFLYPVKTLSEQAALTLSPTESAKTSVAMTIISRRAGEHESAEKQGNTKEIQQTRANFNSAVVEIRKTEHLNKEKIESEIRRYEAPSQEQEAVQEKDTEEKSIDTPHAEQSSPTPRPTIQEQSHHEDSSRRDSTSASSEED